MAATLFSVRPPPHAGAEIAGPFRCDSPVAPDPWANQLTRRFYVTVQQGFHVRAATLFAQTALLYQANITIARRHGDFINGKSIMGLLTLELRFGEEVIVSAKGADAAEALAAIAGLFADAFEQRNSDESPRVMPVGPNMLRRATVVHCA